MDTQQAPAPTPGHPAGCCCGECEIRRQHDPSDPRHQRCAEHGRCLDCDGCDPCEAEAQRSDAIGLLVFRYPEKVHQAERAIGEVRSVVSELMQLYDIETAEGSEGPDALHELDEILCRLRHVRRIADARVALEKAYQIAAAANSAPEPEFDDDAALSFTREQVNEWAGRRLTDDELTRLAGIAPLSPLPAAVAAMAAALDRNTGQEG